MNFHVRCLVFLLQCRFLITSIKNDIDFNSDIELLNLDDLVTHDISNNISSNNSSILDQSYNSIYNIPNPLIDISYNSRGIINEEISTEDMSFNTSSETLKYSTNTSQDNYSQMLQSLESTNKSQENMTLVISEANQNNTSLQKQTFCIIL